MARARFGGRGGAVGTEATRGRALSSAQTGNPIVPDSLQDSILGLARAAVAARRAAGTGSLQWWLWGEARGPARGQLSSRAASRRARGEARGNHGKRTCKSAEQRLGRAKVGSQSFGGNTHETGSRRFRVGDKWRSALRFLKKWPVKERSARDCANRDRRGADAQGCGRRLGASTTLLSLKSLCGERDCCVWWRAAVLSSLPFAVSALPGRSIL